LNCLSQGTQSIIQWLAHLLIGYAEYYDFPENLEDKPGILIIDEIDAHLHPSWQQRIVPVLTKHFPNLQIFFSTHSPLMLAGLRKGQVHLLHREGDGKVTVTRNEEDIVGWSADEILRSFMGMRSPTDLGTAQAVARLQELRSREQLSSEEEQELNSLRKKRLARIALITKILEQLPNVSETVGARLQEILRGMTCRHTELSSISRAIFPQVVSD